MDENKKVAQDILNILSKAGEAEMYGSIEIYIEAGNVTQITQRIIKKISKPNKVLTSKKIKTSRTNDNNESTLKYSP